MDKGLDRQPFGEVSCEDELETYQEDYKKHFFLDIEFNQKSLENRTYLIIGRRGSGKSSLCQFFKFQNVLQNAISIEVDQVELYDRAIAEITEKSSPNRNQALARMSKIWNFLLWSIIFNDLQDEHPEIKKACLLNKNIDHPRKLVILLIKKLLSKFADETNELSEELEDYLVNKTFQIAKQRVFEFSEKKHIILSIDTLEHYELNDQKLMIALSSLVEAACKFNKANTQKNVHIKLFVSAEIYPQLCVSGISNTIKYIQNQVYLHWRPKCIMRLVCWRFAQYLKCRGYVGKEKFNSVKWENFKIVRKQVWLPYFKESLLNKNGFRERTFPFVLRHTQLRPRQMVLLCNKIADHAMLEDNTFPEFHEEGISKAVYNATDILADEVINSYSQIYLNVAKILNALHEVPIIFSGRLIDQLAPRTASEWPIGTYSPYNFMRLIAELGIVGCVRGKLNGNIVEADFEYNMPGELIINEKSKCVLHPMFYKKFRASIINPKLIVFPFPDHPDFNETLTK